MTNQVELEGAVANRDAAEIQVGGSWKLQFTLMVRFITWNPETRQDDLASSFVAVDVYVDGVTVEPVDKIYRGDRVWLRGEIVQAAGEDGKKHTRVKAVVHRITRRGKTWREAQTDRVVGGMRQDPPWAEEPPF